MQHIAGCAAVAHLGDLLSGLDALTLVDQSRAVVSVCRQPSIVVLDDDQLAISDKARTRVHDHASGGRTHGLARLPGDVVFIVGGTLPFLYITWLGLRHFRTGKTVTEMPEDVLFTELVPQTNRSGE